MQAEFFLDDWNTPAGSMVLEPASKWSLAQTWLDIPEKGAHTLLGKIKGSGSARILEIILDSELEAKQ